MISLIWDRTCDHRIQNRNSTSQLLFHIVYKQCQINSRLINQMCLGSYIRILTETRSPPEPRLPKRIEDTHRRNHNLIGYIHIYIYIYIYVNKGIIYYKLNYHDQKIRQTLHATYVTTGQLFQFYFVCHMQCLPVFLAMVIQFIT